MINLATRKEVLGHPPSPVLVPPPPLHLQPLLAALPPPPPPLSPTPIFSQFATTTAEVTPAPKRVANLPRGPASNVASSPSMPQDAPTTPLLAPPQSSNLLPIIPVPPTSLLTPPAAAISSAPLEDGPLFRAKVHSLERRLIQLRLAMKKILNAASSSLSALQANAVAQSLMDESFEALSLSSSTSRSDVLGGLYEGVLRKERERSRERRKKEIRELEELMARIRGGYERLKTLEGRKKVFEAESKAYYDAVGKVSSTNGLLEEDLTLHSS